MRHGPAPRGIDVDPNANELEQWPKAIMGFVSKGVEVADQLPIESDRDPGPRGRKQKRFDGAIRDESERRSSLRRLSYRELIDVYAYRCGRD